MSETRDLDTGTQLDIDKDGNIWAITIEPRSPTPLHTWTIRSCRHKPHDTSRGRQPPTRPRGWLRERGHDAIPSTITLAERSTIAPFLNSPPTSIRHHNHSPADRL
ncbi:MAG: hypothetical protein NNA25_09950 [Nitrospira sp.]|nr:hypothetical protein [Nitrospira sp.]